jgi:hypothetical protein
LGFGQLARADLASVAIGVRGTSVRLDALHADDRPAGVELGNQEDAPLWKGSDVVGME